MDPIIIAIDTDIGPWGGITATMVREQLAAIAPGSQVEIVINSPGGSVFEGVALFNVLKDYAKILAITVIIQGLAASMASYVALGAKAGNRASVVKAEENAIFMIHNPWTISVGDYRALQKDAVFLERLAVLLATTYTACSKLKNLAVRSAMDEETFYIGQEIADAGFVDEIIPAALEDDKAQAMVVDRPGLVAQAKIAVEQAIDRAEKNQTKDSLEKAVALFDSATGRGGNPPTAIDEHTNPASAGTTEEPMTPEELLAKYPDCYRAVLARGVEQERKRADAHLKMAEGANSYETAAKYIRDGASLNDDSVIADYQVKAMQNQAAVFKAKALADRETDNPNGVRIAGEKDGQEAMLASLDKEIGGKK